MICSSANLCAILDSCVPAGMTLPLSTLAHPVEFPGKGGFGNVSKDEK